MEGSAHGPPAVPRLPGFSWPSALGQGLQKGDCGSGGQLAEKGGSYWGLSVGSPDPLRSMMLLSLYKQSKETTAQRDRLFFAQGFTVTESQCWGLDLICLLFIWVTWTAPRNQAGGGRGQVWS